MKALREFNTRLERSEAAAPRDYDTLEGLLPKLKRDLAQEFPQRLGQYARRRAARKDPGLLRDAVRRIEQFKANADADLASTSARRNGEPGG